MSTDPPGSTHRAASHGDPPRRIGVVDAVWRLLLMLVLATVMGVLLAGFVVPFVALTGMAGKATAHSVSRLGERLEFDPLPQRSRVLDRSGHLVTTFYDENRVSVPLRRVAPVMRRAILAIEDARFYQHGAWDLQGTLRAFVNNQMGDGVQGGSSITQQLVKLTLVSQADTPEELEAATEKTYRRKLQELRYAIGVEKRYTKDQILQRYLNLAYFGDGAHGIEAAARHYFSRRASQLTLRQAALLAGLVRNPTGYDPVTRPTQALERRNVVLQRMAELGAISQARYGAARERGLGLRVHRLPHGCANASAPFFCQYVREWLLADDALGKTAEQRREVLDTYGVTVRTTLDLRTYRAALRAVRSHVHPTDRAVGALAFVEPGTGAVRAIAQSRPMGRGRGETFLGYAVPKEYGDANGFQAGSTFKAFVLSAAVDQGIPLDTRIHAPTRVRIPVDRYTGCHGRLRSDDVWKPESSTGSGTFNLYKGTQQSVNTFFAKLELRTGLCEPYRLASRMGIDLDDPDNQQVPSFTLGVVDTDPLTMASAYATFAARGRYCTPRPVTAVLGRSGRPIARYGADCRTVLRAKVADAVNDVLRGVQEPGGFGYSAGLALQQPSAAKTGTTNSNRAVWFIGYTPDMTAAAMIAGVNAAGHWRTLNGQVVGGQLILSAAGSTNAGPMWGDAMKVVQRWLPDEDFVPPDPRLVHGPDRKAHRGGADGGEED